MREKKNVDPDVIRTRSLLIWSQTRYRCATESDECTVVQFSGESEHHSEESWYGATTTAPSIQCGDWWGDWWGVTADCCLFVQLSEIVSHRAHTERTGQAQPNKRYFIIANMVCLLSNKWYLISMIMPSHILVTESTWNWIQHKMIFSEYYTAKQTQDCPSSLSKLYFPINQT